MPSTDETPENVLEDRRQYMCNVVGLSYGTCPRISSDELTMRQIAAKFMSGMSGHFSKRKRHGVQVFTELEFVAPGQTNIALF
ncbi:hypothetical protein C0J52_13982 [Blattella germanica]|nr:hypothetical protein C0J52_13982 [Blattella germanica]